MNDYKIEKKCVVDAIKQIGNYATIDDDVIMQDVDRLFDKLDNNMIDVRDEALVNTNSAISFENAEPDDMDAWSSWLGNSFPSLRHLDRCVSFKNVDIYRVHVGPENISVRIKLDYDNEKFTGLTLAYSFNTGTTAEKAQFDKQYYIGSVSELGSRDNIFSGFEPDEAVECLIKATGSPYVFSRDENAKLIDDVAALQPVIDGVYDATVSIKSM